MDVAHKRIFSTDFEADKRIETDESDLGLKGQAAVVGQVYRLVLHARFQLI